MTDVAVRASPAATRSDDDAEQLNRLTRPWFVVTVSLVLFCTLSVMAAAYSGGFTEADGISHYLKRRHALENPFYLVDIWARPLCVWIYALPGHFFGLIGVRLTSLALAVAIGLLSWSVAKRLKLPRPELVVPLLCGQPMFFMHSCGELTELTFALLLLGMFWAYQRQQWLMLATIAAMAPLARPEGFGFLAVVASALIVHRRWWWTPVLLAGLAIWSYAGWRVFGGPVDYPWWMWLKVNWPFSPASAYGSGSWLAFLAPLPVLVGPFAMPFALAGVWWIARPGAEKAIEENAAPVWRLNVGTISRFLADHDARCRLLVPTLAVGMLVAHTVLWILGLMASAGMIRYLVTVAPFWAILALAGWNRFTVFWPVRRPTLWLAVGVLTILPIHEKFKIYPIRIQGMQVLAERTAEWVRDHPELADRSRFPRVMTSLPSLFYAMDVDEGQFYRAAPWGRKQIEHPEAGVLMVYEAETGSFNANASSIVPRELIDASGWKRIGVVEHAEDIWVNSSKTTRVYRAEIFLSPEPAKGR